jgi:hypothetical protein
MARDRAASDCVPGWDLIRCRVPIQWSGESFELAGQVGPGAPLPTSPLYRDLQRSQRVDHSRRVRLPSTALALGQPVSWTDVPPLTVAPRAGCCLVLSPGRTAFHPGYEMFGGGSDEPIERSTAPHAGRAVTFHARLQPSSVVQLGEARGNRVVVHNIDSRSLGAGAQRCDTRTMIVAGAPNAMWL